MKRIFRMPALRPRPLRAFIKRGEGEEGVTAIEFAMIAPALLLMMFGTIEFSMIMFAQSVMESATSNTSRLGKTGFTAAGISREQTLRNMLQARTAPLLDIDDFTIISTVYPDFGSVGDEEPYADGNGNGSWDAGETYTDVNGNGQWDADMGAAGLGDAGDVVVYTVTYPWQIMTPIMDTMIGTNGTYTLTTRTVVKNEPYTFE